MRNYLITLFPILVCVIPLLILAIQKYKRDKSLSTYVILICVAIGVLTVIDGLEIYAKDSTTNIEAATFYTALGYSLRPFYLILFMLLANVATKKVWLYFIPLIINAVFYFGAFAYDTTFGQLTFWYSINEAGNALDFNRGVINFLVHIICVIYMAFILFRSAFELNGRHRTEAIILILCGVAVTIALVVDILYRSPVLNLIVALCLVFYYLFLIFQKNKLDELTSTFDRRTFYEDIDKNNKRINAIIQLDMNGLKSINDNFGHHEGDVALREVAKIFAKHITKKMCLYRMGGDEFLILCFNEKEENIQQTIADIKKDLEESRYSVAIGYTMRENPSIDLLSVSFEAEKNMYKDKEEYYQSTEIQRRTI